MGLYKVMIEQGAFIDDTLYREGEVVELPEGIDPLWGVKCKADGTELETMSEKVARSVGINEHLAKSIEPTNKADEAIAAENAKLRDALDAQQKQIDGLTKLLQDQPKVEAPADAKGSDDKVVEPKNDAPAKPPLDEASAKAVDETVKMLEDANDEHWTTRGEPQLALIKEYTGLDVSRDDVDSVNDRRRVKPQS